MGLSDATRRVADHARSIVQLELKLAAAELRRKLVALGAGIGLTLTAAALGFFALATGLAAGIAGIATVFSVWLSLLIVFGGLVLLAAILGSVGVALLRRGAKPVPEQAIEEARLTTEALRNGH
jgi:membrane protein implicated in regulation of membrane protease activity